MLSTKCTLPFIREEAETEKWISNGEAGFNSRHHLILSMDLYIRPFHFKVFEWGNDVKVPKEGVNGSKCRQKPRSGATDGDAGARWCITWITKHNRRLGTESACSPARKKEINTLFPISAFSQDFRSLQNIKKK